MVLLKTDQAVVEATGNFFKLFSDAESQPHFLNMSWIFPQLRFQMSFLQPQYGLTVVAVGNEGGENVVVKNTQMGARSTNPGDVLAVMNLDAMGNPICKTSVLNTQWNLYCMVHNIEKLAHHGYGR